MNNRCIIDISNFKKIKFHGLYLNVLPNDWMGMSMISNKLFEPHITKFLLNELNSDSCFVDIGSNYGYHSIVASKFCKTVYSFEPQKIIYESQKISIDDNKISNINLYNYAIGDHKKLIKMMDIEYVGGGNEINVGETSINKESLEVSDTGDTEMHTLDSLIKNKIDIIKIDVQGFEKFVLQGSMNVISLFKPSIIVEIENHQLGKFGYNSEQLFSIIKKLNYNIYLLDSFYPSDFVCISKDKKYDFQNKNKEFIKPILTDNGLNNCLSYGITEKISYSDEITHHTIKSLW